MRQDAATAALRAGRRRRDRRALPDLIEELKEIIRADPEHLDAIVLLFSVARYLERLADHATNIAEDVLYMVEGEIHRHHMPNTPAELLRWDDARDVSAARA